MGIAHDPVAFPQSYTYENLANFMLLCVIRCCRSIVEYVVGICQKNWEGFMRGEWNLRQELIVRFALSALVPVLIFAFATQLNMQRNQKFYLDEQIQNTLETADRGLDMMLDKYAVILYDLCIDEDILEAAEEINQGNDEAEMNRNTFCRRLNHICDRDDEIIGITVYLADGNVIFYDNLTSSSEDSQWAGSVPVPVSEYEVGYGSTAKPIVSNGENIYTIQIAKKLVDTRRQSEILGTVVLSVNENQIQYALDAGEESPIYLLDGNIVISATDETEIGQKFTSLMEEKENAYKSITNDTSGFIIWNEQPLDFYFDFIWGQNLLLGIVAVLSAVAVILLTYSFTRPYLQVVDSYVEAMNRVQEGDLTARAKADTRIPAEMSRIGHGFNKMVVNIENLIEQVKQASMEQRNAELYALEAQIDPHFLYNTLDVINWKAIENEQYEISHMLGALADILRYTVKNAGGTASLREGMMWLENYILLQSAKLGKKPEIIVKISEELMGMRIHKLLLQPFVENAMKYAFEGKKDDCVLIISANLVDSQLHIVLEDNGNGIQQDMLELLNDENADMGEHMGVANVRKRLKLYYGEEAQVYFESMPESYTRAHLFIPVKEEISCGSQ